MLSRLAGPAAVKVKRAAFLTMEDPDGWEIDAHLAIPHLRRHGWRVETLCWRAPAIDWSDFDAVYIGTAWDYPKAANEFLQTLQRIEDAGATLVNPLEIVQWNVDKSYLRDLQTRGVSVVPTSWIRDSGALDLDAEFARFDCERIVVKPLVSTNATDTFALSKTTAGEFRSVIDDAFFARPCMVQPFVSSIESAGEVSLFYIDSALTHAIRKIPRAGDFRVQEEHGASLAVIEPTAEMLSCASPVLPTVSPQPVYARIDIVEGAGGWQLMELELIEPSLYFRLYPRAASLFAAAFDRYAA